MMDLRKSFAFNGHTLSASTRLFLLKPVWYLIITTCLERNFSFVFLPSNSVPRGMCSFWYSDVSRQCLLAPFCPLSYFATPDWTLHFAPCLPEPFGLNTARKKHDRQCNYESNIEAPSRIHCCRGSAISANGIFADGLLTVCQHIYHCCVYSKNLLMMDRGTVRNM